MKNKLLILLIPLLFLIGGSRVEASTTLQLNGYYSHFLDASQNDHLTDMLEYYNSNGYSEDYPYWYYYVYTGCGYKVFIDLYISKYPSDVSFYSNNDTPTLYLATDRYRLLDKNNNDYKFRKISASIQTYGFQISGLTDDYYESLIYYGRAPYSSCNDENYRFNLYATNDDIYFERPLYDSISNDNDLYYNKLLFPSANINAYGNTFFSKESFEVKIHEHLPTFKSLLDGTYNTPLNNLTEINLNDYEYVILVPKFDSITAPFTSNVYYTGSYCMTSVLNFGQTERNEFWGNCVVNSPKYDDVSNINDFNKVLSSITIDEDSYNQRAVYYIEPKYRDYNSYFYYDSEIFDVVYISDSTANPIISYNGKDYTALRYSDLNTTAHSNDDNGIIGGNSSEFSLYSLWQNLKNSINNVVTKLLKGLQELFIPSDGYFTYWFNSLSSFFSEKLGLLLYPFDLITDLFNRFTNLSSSELIFSIPDIKLPLFNEVIIHATTFSLNSIVENSDFGFIYNIYLTIVDFILIISLVKLASVKFNEIVKERSIT